ncbi:hypothetical protein [Nocardia brasiliensis]|uniref:hypothetical protein n=1 Tax=Nocardia brasiliensis TaxID=37326 RepID=UPI001894C426|nr:hypothetical protein [Nocardia brasiliensis]MBF6548837.1 hypothetical protein [Nocardia brasiliensis]
MGEEHEEKDVPNREPMTWDRARKAAVDISTIGSFVFLVGAAVYTAVTDTNWATIVNQLASALRAVAGL